MKVLVLDTIHGGSVLAEALLREGHDVDALDVYREKTLLPSDVESRKYDIITAPVHLDPDHPLMKIKPVISHHKMTGQLCRKHNAAIIEITGTRGKTTTSFAVAHVLGRNGIIHTSRGTFHDEKLLFKKSITPASLLLALTACEKEHADWIVAEESLGVCGVGDFCILTSGEDYRIANGKRSALDVKLESLDGCKTVLVPAGVPRKNGWICIDDLVSSDGDTISYKNGSFCHPLIRLPAYNQALKIAAACALLLGKDPMVLSSFEAIEGRMNLIEMDGVTILDNSNSGINAEITINAAKYLRSVTRKDIILVIGEGHKAVCEGFSEKEMNETVDFICPRNVIYAKKEEALDSLLNIAINEAKKADAAVLLAVKTWR